RTPRGARRFSRPTAATSDLNGSPSDLIYTSLWKRAPAVVGEPQYCAPASSSGRASALRRA
ncbi:hypothetical protein, partial [Actinomadura sp. 9N215]|uniref:hypothetical protein n=1 Tax=Actinomadura sp. 9N215 TaxID=3375150 RepID=UPI0037B39409